MNFKDVSTIVRKDMNILNMINDSMFPQLKSEPQKSVLQLE